LPEGKSPAAVRALNWAAAAGNTAAWIAAAIRVVSDRAPRLVGRDAPPTEWKPLALSDNQRQPSPARPHLIHVGYAKSGSSFLRRWFSEHQQIAFLPGGFAGLRVADVAGDPGAIRLRVTSSENFASPLLPDRPLESGAFSAAQVSAAETLAELFPTAHILIVTRGYRSMIMSSYSQYVRSGGTVPLRQVVEEAQQEAAWDYDALLGTYRRLFGPEKVLVLPWELLRDSPGNFVRTIEARFGLSHHPPSPERVNRSLSPSEMRWYPRFAAAIAKAPLGPRLKKRLTERFGHIAHDNRLAGLVGLLQRASPAVPVSLDALPPAALEVFRGKARSLAAEPLFTPYAADYLNDSPA
jgi:hypothetical protein